MTHRYPGQAAATSSPVDFASGGQSGYEPSVTRAVLTRLREPTPGMNQAGAHAALIQRQRHMGIFRAMIDAALEGE